MADRPPSDPGGLQARNRTVAAILAAALIITIAAVGYFRPVPTSVRSQEGNLLESPARIAPFAVTTLDGAKVQSRRGPERASWANSWPRGAPRAFVKCPPSPRFQDGLARAGGS